VAGSFRERALRLCIFGAGAIGGLLAVGLALAGHEVSVVARGEHLRRIRQNGLRLRIGGREKRAEVVATDDPATLGEQDFVLCALKAHQAHENAARFAPLLGPRTAVVTAMNGIPWWYFYRCGGALEGRTLDSVDPGGAQWRLIGPERAIGCVVDPACEVVEPGVIAHHEFNRFTLGEPSGERTDRIEALAAALTGAGFDAPIRDQIRWNVWLKLWGNVCFNPIAALTLATLDRIATEPALRAACLAMMQEARAVGDALGVVIPEAMIERRIAAAATVTGHKMSMLQDLERGRSLEIDALVAAVQELARLVGVATPAIDLVLGLVQERARCAGLYG
jgi:2-dehydropantoate 2-reductase